MSKSSLFLKSLLALSLIACSGGSGTKTTDGSAVTQNQTSQAPSATTPTNTTNTPKTDAPADTVKALAQGSYKKPHVVAATKDLQAHHFYNIAGYKVCSSGYSPKDYYKKNLFINIAGADETCGTDPKAMLTLILRKSVMIQKNITPPEPGKKIIKGVIFPQKDAGNNRLVAFISEDVATNKFTL